MKVYLNMVGCRLNQAEIETYARQFRAAGHTLVADPGEADLAVVNTCAVTSAAASDSRQMIRQVERAGVGGVVVTGCWSTLYPREAAALLSSSKPGIRCVVTNKAKDELVAGLGVTLQCDLPHATFDLEPLERRTIPGARLRTRAFIKVQDGCDNRCTFCITTLARGPGRSRHIDEVLQDIRSVAGTQEVVLTGVHLGSWGHDLEPPSRLSSLVQAILDGTDVPRLRLSSLEPWDLGDDFFRLWKNPRLCRHLHLPLQSGCAATLRRMARQLTPPAFADLVQVARSAIPDMAITTDLIAGFPGESEADFQESLDFVRQMNFAGGHVFTYSARPGTVAVRLSPQVPHPVRKERNARLRAVLADSARLYQERFIGQELPVLWESVASLGAQGWEMSGLTGNYLRVNARAPRSLWNQVTPVRLTRLVNDHFLGDIVVMS